MKAMDKIYIIEDDENIRNLLKIALEGFGYEAQGFETAEEGLEQIAKEPPALVIFDWMLPGMDGVTAIRQLRETEAGRDMPIMLLTAKEKELDNVVAVSYTHLDVYKRQRSPCRERKRRSCPLPDPRSRQRPRTGRRRDGAEGRKKPGLR